MTAAFMLETGFFRTLMLCKNIYFGEKDKQINKKEEVRTSDPHANK